MHAAELIWNSWENGQKIVKKKKKLIPSSRKEAYKIQENLELPTPKMNQPIRIALTGSTQSPSLGLTIKLMGQNKSIDLIQKAIRFLE